MAKFSALDVLFSIDKSLLWRLSCAVDVPWVGLFGTDLKSNLLLACCNILR